MQKEYFSRGESVQDLLFSEFMKERSIIAPAITKNRVRREFFRIACNIAPNLSQNSAFSYVGKNSNPELMLNHPSPSMLLRSFPHYRKTVLEKRKSAFSFVLLKSAPLYFMNDLTRMPLIKIKSYSKEGLESILHERKLIK